MEVLDVCRCAQFLGIVNAKPIMVFIIYFSYMFLTLPNDIEFMMRIMIYSLLRSSYIILFIWYFLSIKLCIKNYVKKITLKMYCFYKESYTMRVINESKSWNWFCHRKREKRKRNLKVLNMLKWKLNPRVLIAFTLF